jgi:hypothetical protein
VDNWFAQYIYPHVRQNTVEAVRKASGLNKEVRFIRKLDDWNEVDYDLACYGMYLASRPLERHGAWTYRREFAHWETIISVSTLGGSSAFLQLLLSKVLVGLSVRGFSADVYLADAQRLADSFLSYFARLASWAAPKLHFFPLRSRTHYLQSITHTPW